VADRSRRYALTQRGVAATGPRPDDNNRLTIFIERGAYRYGLKYTSENGLSRVEDYQDGPLRWAVSRGPQTMYDTRDL